MEHEMKSPFAFISYSSYNYAAALEIKHLLAANDISCWMAPESIAPGSDYSEKIPEAIEHCSVFILALSKESQESVWVPKELDLALTFRKTVIPFHIDTSALAESFNFKLTNVQRIAAFGRYSEACRELIQTIHAIFGIAQNEGTTPAPIIPDQLFVLKPGSIIGEKYRITSFLGRGSLSTVFLAENVLTGTLWAIKAIPKDASYYEEYIKGFSKQLNIMKTLDHPALPKIIDIIQDTKHFLIVMNYADGEPLRRKLVQDGRADESQIIDWAKQLCDLLIYQHAQTPPIINNDVNIKNVFIKQNGKLALIDFGSFLRYIPKTQANKTAIGTHFFKAPEFYQGECDCRSDIYELGTSLYLLATGVSIMDMIHKYPVQQLNPNISSGLAYIIDKCLQDNPDCRYQTAADLLTDLKGINNIQQSDTPKNRQGKKTNKIFSKFFRKWVLPQ